MFKLNLEQQRKRAKDLLHAHRRGDREAAERIARQLSRIREPFKLADAQLVIAREAGFASWSRLVQHVERAGRTEPVIPLHAAVRAGDPAATRAALVSAEPWHTREAIEEAIARDDRELVRLLLAHRGWVDTAGRAGSMGWWVTRRAAPRSRRRDDRRADCRRSVHCGT